MEFSHRIKKIGETIEQVNWQEETQDIDPDILTRCREKERWNVLKLLSREECLRFESKGVNGFKARTMHHRQSWLIGQKLLKVKGRAEELKPVKEATAGRLRQTEDNSGWCSDPNLPPCVA
ncbi:hypothetical protein ACFE04_010710 [Oxalis oulophora]